MEKLNLTYQSKEMYHSLQHKIKIKKLKPGLVASYDIRPGNGDGPILISTLHKFVTYFLT